MGKNQEGQQVRHPGGSLTDYPTRIKGRWNILQAAGRSLTIAISLENTKQQRGNSSGGVWSVWKMTS